MVPSQGSWHGFWTVSDNITNDVAFVLQEPSQTFVDEVGHNACIYMPGNIWVHRSNSKEMIARCFVEIAEESCTHGFYMRFREGYLNEVKPYLGRRQKPIPEINEFLEILNAL